MIGAVPHQRYVVAGPPGSGKSTLARRLAGLLTLDLIELDTLYWERDWKVAPADVFRARAEEPTRAPAWIVAGDHHLARDIVWSRADAILWLDYSLPIVFWRLSRRTARRAVTREVLWNGNREAMWPHLKLWSESSLLRHLLKTYPQEKRMYPALFAQPAHAHLTVIRFRSPSDTDAWLDRFAPTGRR